MNSILANKPPGLSLFVLLRTPTRHRKDAVQEGWVALLTGRNPSTAAKIYVRRELRHEERMTPMSQLPGDDHVGSAETPE